MQIHNYKSLVKDVNRGELEQEMQTQALMEDYKHTVPTPFTHSTTLKKQNTFVSVTDFVVGNKAKANACSTTQLTSSGHNRSKK